MWNGMMEMKVETAVNQGTREQGSKDKDAGREELREK
jgi:hypothetical protein